MAREPQTDLASAISEVMGGLPWRSLAQGGVMQTMPYAVHVK